MNKAELIAEVAAKAELTKKDAEKAVNAFIDTVIATVAKGKKGKNDGPDFNKVQLIGFGTFEGRDRGPRDGKAPGTGEEYHIPAVVVPAFKAGKAFKDAVAATRKPAKKAAAKKK